MIILGIQLSHLKTSPYKTSTRLKKGPNSMSAEGYVLTGLPVRTEWKELFTKSLPHVLLLVKMGLAWPVRCKSNNYHPVGNDQINCCRVSTAGCTCFLQPGQKNCIDKIICNIAVSSATGQDGL